MGFSSKQNISLLKKLPNCDLSNLILAQNDLLGGGAALCSLTSNCSNLRILDLNECNLNGQDLDQIFTNVKHSTCINIERLDLSDRDLRGRGSTLNELMTRCPELHTLEMCSCGLTVANIEQMVDGMPERANLLQLRLADNDDLRGGETAVGRLLQRLPRLQLLHVSWCGLSIPDLLQGAGRAALTYLRVLDLGGNQDGDLEVSDYLASTPRLQALSVADCCDDVHALLRLVTSLPPSLTHLDVHDNNIDMQQVLQQKERLARLHRLNIGRYDPKKAVMSIRKELQRLNPHIQVYWDRDERLWDMYKDTIQDT